MGVSRGEGECLRRGCLGRAGCLGRGASGKGAVSRLCVIINYGWFFNGAMKYMIWCRDCCVPPGGSTEEARIRNDITYSVTSADRMALVTIVYNPEFVSIEWRTSSLLTVHCLEHFSYTILIDLVLYFRTSCCIVSLVPDSFKGGEKKESPLLGVVGT